MFDLIHPVLPFGKCIHYVFIFVTEIHKEAHGLDKCKYLYIFPLVIGTLQFVLGFNQGLMLLYCFIPLEPITVGTKYYTHTMLQTYLATLLSGLALPYSIQLTNDSMSPFGV